MSRPCGRLRLVALLLAFAFLGLAGVLPPQAQADGGALDDHGPLAVVLDVSGSMNDDDGTGTVKLDGAKEALISVVRSPSLRDGQMGLWTYPGGESVQGCPAGQWEQPIGKDRLTLAARINGLTADGGTPTGPALRAAADSLKASGYQTAVILLVSDGMSNCGPPPCEVAQQLVDEGFELTVQAMGFQIDEAGRRELECVAQVTQGAYYDAKDAADLVEKIEQYGIPRLSLDVDAPGHVASGDVAEITARVTNTSGQAIPGVTLSVAALAGDSTTILPALVPPLVPLGNLPPGNTGRTYTWRIPVGSLTKGGTARLRAVATAGGSVAPAVEEFHITALGPDFGARKPTWLSKQVADGSTANILIFGDSYSSGEGAGDYDAGTAIIDVNECHRSRRTYLAAAGLQGVRIVACSGAVSYDVISSSRFDEPPQVENPQVFDVRGPVDVAFMTIGGNDVQFADILTDCIVGSDAFTNPVLACDEGWGHVFANIAMKRRQLRETYEAVYSAINAPGLVTARGAIAPLVILPYPNLVPARATGSCGLDPDELRFAQRVVATLNETIENAVNDARSDGLHDGIIFASQVRTAIGTHGMCSEDPHFNNPTLVRSGVDQFFHNEHRSEWGHLDARGYLDVTRAIQNWSYTQDIDPSEIAPSPEILESMLKWYERSPSQTVDVDSAELVTARPGSTIRVTGSGFVSGSPVLVGLHSVPRALTNTRADEAGRVDAVVGIPPDAELGRHRLVLEGFGPDLAPLARSVPLAVGAPEPWWLIPGLYVAGGLAAAGLVLLVVGLVMRRSSRHRPAPAVSGP